LDPNIDRLHWLMSRFQGHVGIAGRAGGRSVTSEAAFAPILREITNRGLIYVDGSSSLESSADRVAGSGSSGVAKANLVLDAVPSPAKIDRALAKLEGLARQKGAAIGFATAWPVAIECIARWSKAVEGRGFSLVPITAAAARGNPPIGQTPSRLPKLGAPRKLRIAAAGTAGSLLGVAILVGTRGR
jgi:polysaccharide deacetylase 2 family uncharacterized protein YibQ